MSIDIEQVARDVEGEVPDDAKLNKVGHLVGEQVRLESEVADLASMLQHRRDDLRRVSEELLPAAMMEAGGLREITLQTGEKISVVPFYAATISAANRERAHQWLREHGHADLIKHTITASFGRGEDEEAKVARLALEGIGVEVADEERVHPQTLKAFVREQTESGVDLPDSMNVFVGQRTKIGR